MDTNGLIDHRNLKLWNFLRTIHDIEIRKEKRPDYLAFSKNGKTIISVPFDNIDTASFTHELLHIYLRTKEVFIGGGLKRSIKGSEKLYKVFTDKLIEHIGNCLDHIKMFPEFIKLGYDESDFLSDYSVNKLTKDEIAKIKSHYTTSIFFKKVYNASAVDFFIGKYFAANSCPNKTYDYKVMLHELEKIDPDLYQVLETFLSDWKNFDYDNADPITGGYHSLLFDFINNLEKWTDGKTIK
jgi:hypothetical protein